MLDELIQNHPFYKLSLCESPIELKFFVFFSDKVPGIKPQQVVGPNRVDFAVSEKKIVFEIDGHEFHASREDRTRDAKRERYLHGLSWPVIRFTGTEIHNDILGCIKDAIKLVE